MDLMLRIRVILFINIILIVVGIGLFIWRMRQSDDQWWARYEKKMLGRGMRVERTPEWERQNKLHRMVLVFAIVSFCVMLVIVGRMTWDFMT